MVDLFLYPKQNAATFHSSRSGKARNNFFGIAVVVVLIFFFLQNFQSQAIVQFPVITEQAFGQTWTVKESNSNGLSECSRIGSFTNQLGASAASFTLCPSPSFSATTTLPEDTEIILVEFNGVAAAFDDGGASFNIGTFGFNAKGIQCCPQGGATSGGGGILVFEKRNDVFDVFLNGNLVQLGVKSDRVLNFVVGGGAGAQQGSASFKFTVTKFELVSTSVACDSSAWSCDGWSNVSDSCGVRSCALVDTVCSDADVVKPVESISCTVGDLSDETGFEVIPGTGIPIFPKSLDFDFDTDTLVFAAAILIGLIFLRRVFK